MKKLFQIDDKVYYNTSNESPIEDKRGAILTKGDIVILMNADDLNNNEIQHNKGDILQYIGGDYDNIGCFIHCATKKRTDFFADRTLKINKTQIL
jgi:hypothetical protein